MNMMNFIFAVCIYPSLFLMYFIQKGEATPASGILFGIRYTSDWLPDSERDQYLAEYRRTMNRYLLIFLLLPLPAFFIPYASISYTIWMLWMTAVIIAFMLPYIRGNSKLKKLKKERCPERTPEEIRYIELKNAGIIRRVKWQQFLPPCLISAILAILVFSFFAGKDLALYGILVVIFALCTLLFYGTAVCMDRTKTKVISDDSDINVNFTRATKNIYKNCWLQCAWLNVVYQLVITIALIVEVLHFTHATAIILWGTVIYTLGILWFCVKMVKKLQRLSRKYSKKMNSSYDSEEDHWIGGMLYYNPKDKHTMVDKRLGTGTTMNMATPTGMVLTVFSALCLLIIPLSCIWMILLEFMPITLFVDRDMLVARQLKNDYVIATDTITELTLEDHLPRSSRVSGTGMENLLKGNYRNSIDGRIQIFLNPENTYYMRIVSGDTIYYLAGYDDAETLEVYEQLSKQ